MIATDIQIDPVIDRLTREVKAAAAMMQPSEARYLVDYYYQIQEDRKRANNQTRAGAEGEEPTPITEWLAGQTTKLETRIKSLLDAYSEAQPLGARARGNVGVGPVIAAGLLCHIDIAKAPTTGHIWSFAGLDPRQKWSGTEDTKKQLVDLFGGKPASLDREHVIRACNHFHRSLPTIESKAQPLTLDRLAKALSFRPFNAKLKVLCWKLGETFVKFSGREDCFYGRYWAECKVDEETRNEAGEYAQQAEDKLKRFRIGKETDAYAAYSNGKLPPAHLHARAKRRAVKLFLSHYHEIGYQLHHGRPAPRPWAIEHGGHSHYIAPPAAWGG